MHYRSACIHKISKIILFEEEMLLTETVLNDKNNVFELRLYDSLNLLISLFKDDIFLIFFIKME